MSQHKFFFLPEIYPQVNTTTLKVMFSKDMAPLMNRKNIFLSPKVDRVLK